MERRRDLFQLDQLQCSHFGFNLTVSTFGTDDTSSKVNGQRSTLYAPLGSLFQAQGKSETISYVHYHLQKCKNSAKLEDHKS